MIVTAKEQIVSVDDQSAFNWIGRPPARAAREGADRGFDESPLSEKTRDATETAEQSDAAAGVDPGTETETETETGTGVGAG